MTDRETLEEMTTMEGLPITLTRKGLIKLLSMHSINADEYDTEHPARADYRTVDVMIWLGY